MMKPDEKAAAQEFDAWAEAGRGESMARGHGAATRAAISNWQLTGTSRVLDVGCGNGWAVRALVDQGAALGCGVDISPKMIERARQAVGSDARYEFAVGSGQALPFADDKFSHILSVESLYYYPDPLIALGEWRRVAASEGRLAVMVELFAENPAGQVWADALDINVHLLSEREYEDLAKQAGWGQVLTRRVVDPSPIPGPSEFESSKYWPSYEMFVGYREAGSLVIEAAN